MIPPFVVAVKGLNLVVKCQSPLWWHSHTASDNAIVRKNGVNIVTG